MSIPSAVEIAERLAAGALSAREVADSCLERIGARDGEVRAFAHLDPAQVRAEADALDRHRKAGRPIGPLHGVPVAVKDIIDTATYPTENGSPLDAGRRPRQDATLVARLRAAGALVIGKTVTTEFAYYRPGPTRNPHNLAHTPGGSSQGSAAAVGDGMVPLAIGSQTAGSVIRPASFCGVVGYKPTYGMVSLAGVLSICEPLDTAGVFATTVEDAALVGTVLAGYDAADPRTRPVARADLLAAARSEPPAAPRLAIVRGPTWDAAEPDLVGLIDEIAEALGDEADAVDLPAPYDDAFALQQRLMKVGFARHLTRYLERGADAVSELMRAAIAEGAAVTAVDYLAARDMQTALAVGLDRVFDRYDAILTPAAPGEAPAGIEATGSPVFNALWTFVGTPAITLPLATGSTGLPIGLQLVGRPGEDGRLLRTARWLQRRLAEA
ncbi:amidase [Acuticoccus mangrovi]|uniref:amidase n=1 Tax=Acuticoccus mangrovi TaxID=2796142 RepID=UPI002FCA26CD